MLDISQLSPEQIEIIQKYKDLYSRVGSLKIRMEILKQELSEAIKEISELREKEHELFDNLEQNITKNTENNG
jgi:hypothetical protein